MSAILTNFLLIIHQPAPTLLNLDGHTSIAILGICVGTFENFLLCLLLGAALSIIARSAAFGIAAGFGYLIGEDIAAQILPVIGKSLHICPWAISLTTCSSRQTSTPSMPIPYLLHWQEALITWMA